MHRSLRSPAWALAAFLVHAAPAPAQESPWSLEGELGASVFFGNTDQTTVTTRAATARADSAYEFAAQASFSYGEATDGEGQEFVVKRSWDLESSLDYHPYGRLSPYVFGKLESSFERRIDLRYNAGAGGKLTLVRGDDARADLSVAALAEQTFIRDAGDAGDVGDQEDLLARWAVRLRGSRAFDEQRVSLSTENFYRPVFDDFGNFVLESKSSLSFRMNDRITLKLSFVDTYDSKAEERGAETKNDGQIFFSVLSSF